MKKFSSLSVCVIALPLFTLAAWGQESGPSNCEICRNPSRTLNMLPFQTVCNPSALADCIQAAQDDVGSCVDDCVDLPVRARANCVRGCRGLFNREKLACNRQFGVCVTGRTCCGGACTSVSSDPQNCGACGNVCASNSCRNGSCVHARRNIKTLSANEIATLQKGIKVMQGRQPSDPTSWIYQANIHGTFDTPALAAWSTCQHGSFFFLSWHRMYLYYFERILRAASGDANLTLPYWNYSDASDPNAPALPLPFRQPADPS